MKHLPYSLLVAAALLLLPARADAAKLESWRFDAGQNQLEFTTDQDVQPTAQLLSDPTRLVIDLPGIVLGRPALSQPGSGAIRAVRVGQFDKGITRIVLELAPGYTIDPAQVKFRGLTARRWTVQIPTPQRSTEAAQPIDPTPNPGSGTVGNGTVSDGTVSDGTVSGTAGNVQLQAIQVTQDGIFLRTSGGTPELRQRRSPDRQQIDFELPNTTIAPGLPRDQPINRFGVGRLQVTQIQSSPPIARVTLNVDRGSGEWQASTSSLGGVALVPTGGVATRPPVTPVPPPAPQLATITAVELNNGSNQLIIRGNQPLRYSTRWDRDTAAYRITIESAQLSSQIRSPQLGAASPIQTLRLRQEDSRTVVILVQPAIGVQVNPLNQPSPQTLALQLQRVQPTTPAPTPPVAVIPVPVPPRTIPTPPVRPVPNGRRVVVIDPGHGGPDPGAIGRGGIQEKEIVLDIGKQVAALLEKQGVQAILTREDDRDLDLEPRVQMAAQVNATVFVSIHANSIDLSRADISGLETYYYDSGLELARMIHASILESTGMPDRRVRQARFYVLRKTSMPSVLVETGFVTGRDDAARLSSPQFRSQMAAAIARGILQYIQQRTS